MYSLAISKVVQRTTLINNPDSSLLSPDPHALDIIASLAQRLKFRVDLVSCVDGGLRVEFGGVGDFEEDVLHYVGCEGHLEFELLALWVLCK